MTSIDQEFEAAKPVNETLGSQESSDSESSEGVQQLPKDRKFLHISERIFKDPMELDFLVPMPEKVCFEDIPQINDAKKVWKLGMRKIEETFAEHVANMHMDFEDKARTYAHIQS